MFEQPDADANQRRDDDQAEQRKADGTAAIKRLAAVGHAREKPGREQPVAEKRDVKADDQEIVLRLMDGRFQQSRLANPCDSAECGQRTFVKLENLSGVEKQRIAHEASLFSNSRCLANTASDAFWKVSRRMVCDSASAGVVV